MFGENKNMLRGTSGIFILMLAAAIALNRIAYYLGAGTEAFNISLLLVLAQTAVIIISYACWYFKVNRMAADMTNIAEMRKMAFRQKNRYLALSVLITGIIALAAILCMLLGILFVDIISLYCYTSVLTMFLLGNLTLFILMRFIGLPNRVTGN